MKTWQEVRANIKSISEEEKMVSNLNSQEELARELNQFRVRNKYTQEDMAKLLCIKQPVYSRFENAKMKKPSEAILTLIEDTLNNNNTNKIRINRTMYFVPKNSNDNSDSMYFYPEEIKNFIRKKENLPYIIEAYFKFKHDRLYREKENYLKNYAIKTFDSIK